MDTILRGALTGVVLAAFAGFVVEANTMAAQTIWGMNGLAAQTAWDIFKAPLERIQREVERTEQTKDEVNPDERGAAPKGAS